MSNKNKNKKTNDEWYSTIDTWKLIEAYIPKDKKIWEAFYGDGSSGEILRKLGYDVYSENLDFFEMLNTKEVEAIDWVITNPPFTKKYPILAALVELNKPFIVVLPLSSINTHSMRKIFGEKMDNVTILMPKGRLMFKNKKGDIVKRPSFESIYLGWKIGGVDKIEWLP